MPPTPEMLVEWRVRAVLMDDDELAKVILAMCPQACSHCNRVALLTGLGPQVSGNSMAWGDCSESMLVDGCPKFRQAFEDLYLVLRTLEWIVKEERGQVV